MYIFVIQLLSRFFFKYSLFFFCKILYISFLGKTGCNDMYF